jgi:hypothetical protein
MRPLRTLRPALAAAATALLACFAGVNQVSGPNPVPGVRQGDWSTVRNLATRRAQLYDRFSQRASATVTYLGVPERQAKVDQLAQWMGWTEQEKARQLKAELDEAARYDDFLLAFYTPERKANDLDLKTSIWRVALKLEGGDLVTHDATTLDVDATVANLYPYISPFDTVYRLRFNKVTPPLTGRTFVLELASALGKLQLTFGDGAIGPDRPQGTPIAD